MLRKFEIEKLSLDIVGPATRTFLSHDAWRMNNNYYGAYYSAFLLAGNLLIIGVRSGLEILHYIKNTSQANIVIIESNEILMEEIKKTIKVAVQNIKNLKIFYYTSIKNFILENKINTFTNTRVSAEQFNITELELLLNNVEIKNIVGEFCIEDHDPLLVYRMCKKKTDRLHLRISGIDEPLNFNGTKKQFEISVVVPCYKVIEWIDKCLESLINQTINSIEIIAIDDGSPDQTGDRLEEWAHRYPDKIRVIHKANGGCASARNEGLLSARGEFIAFVDGDDWVNNSMFEELYRNAIINAADISQCGYIEVYQCSGNINYFPTAWSGKYGDGSYGIITDIYKHLTTKPTIWRRIYKTDNLISNSIIFPQHIRRFDDLPFQFEVLLRANRITIIPECYYYYRQEREGQDISVRDTRLFVHFQIFKWLDERIMSWADSGIEASLIELKLNTHLWAISIIEKKFRRKYLNCAKKDLRKHLHSIGFTKLMLIGMRKGWPGFTLSFASILYLVTDDDSCFLSN